MVTGVFDHTAAQAVKSGASGIIVSNHGGRQADYAPATVDVLAEVCWQVVASPGSSSAAEQSASLCRPVASATTSDTARPRHPHATHHMRTGANALRLIPDVAANSPGGEQSSRGCAGAGRRWNPTRLRRRQVHRLGGKSRTGAKKPFIARRASVHTVCGRLEALVGLRRRCRWRMWLGASEGEALGACDGISCWVQARVNHSARVSAPLCWMNKRQPRGGGGSYCTDSRRTN